MLHTLKTNAVLCLQRQLRNVQRELKKPLCSRSNTHPKRLTPQSLHVLKNVVSPTYSTCCRFSCVQILKHSTKCLLSLSEPAHPSLALCRCMASKQHNVMNVFDRSAKRLQKNRTALLEDYEVYDYLREEVGWRMADRICDVKRKFDVAVDVGCWRGHVAKDVLEDMVGILYQTEMADKVLAQAAVSPEVPTYNIIADEEFFPFKDSSLDLVISSLNLHWVNDLPGTFRQIHSALKNDGCFMGAMFGGDTLFELRVALQTAETEREGGFAAHISPFTTVSDLGDLLHRSGFVMLTIDIDDMVIRYPSMFELMADLKGMGENNCSWSRRSMIPRDTLKAAAAIYQEKYGHKDADGVPATFEVIYFIGWKPDTSQAHAATRGSGQVSLKNIDQFDKLARELKEGSKGDATVEAIAQQIERLREHVVKEAEAEAKRTSTMEDTQDGDKKD